MLLLLLLLLSSWDVRAQRLAGRMQNGSCSCAVNATMWRFPTAGYSAALRELQTCEGALSGLQEKVALSSRRLPEVGAVIQNVSLRLQPLQYLQDEGLYTELQLQLLSRELQLLQDDVTALHSQLDNAETSRLSSEMGKLRASVDRMAAADMTNMQAVREKLRYLKNGAASCSSIPKDFTGRDMHCLHGLITSISEPVLTKLSPYGKTLVSGSWGKEAQMGGPGQKISYWVQTLPSSQSWGNTVRVYQTYEDFMASANHKDFTVAPSYSHADSIQGPSGVLHGEALYYHCARSADVCRYDLNSNAVRRATLPGVGVGFKNTFPYCYYDCRAYSDVDLEADESGLWALYATAGNHGNLVVSRLAWDGEAETLNVTHTWETRLFKKAATNAFMVCGVLYATRYVDETHEEVFYAFDTATGNEDNALALPLEKVAKGVASLSYNPTNQQLYMYNDGYLLAYQAHFLGLDQHHAA
ncbi:olfactomedin-4-like [Clinocottus analis]|uniref:olfactomedin-4-like n=1 Tax=Clinocottus analis TaxID=304258 RepID=UPI0035C0C7D9